jgi:hypothetical protein
VKVFYANSIKKLINLILKDEIDRKILMRKPTKVTKKIMIKFDRKNPRKQKLNKNKNKCLGVELKINKSIKKMIQNKTNKN